jgi:Tfp pilus assembly protein FimT
LIEVLMVLAVALVVGALAAPRLLNIARMYKLKSTAAFVGGAIQSTRYRAISDGYPYQIAFSSTGKSYQLTSDPERDGTYANVGSAIPFTTSSDTVTINQNTTLKFSPSGLVVATAGTTTITLTYNGSTATITVSPYGNVSVVYS